MIAYIALGSNLDNPRQQLATAIANIKAIDGVQLVSLSSVYMTAPVGVVDQPDFYNQVISVDTLLSAHELLRELLSVEHVMGRVRMRHWGERVIDCDLLLFGEQVIQTNDLILPHPRMTERAFVLYPLAEISPDLRLPSGEKVSDLCQAVVGQAIQKCEAQYE